MTFVTAGSDAWFKSGLGKSAFTSKIYRGLPLDHYLPGIQATFEYFNVRKYKEGVRARPKFYMLHDAFMMYYHPAEVVADAVKKNPKKKTVWWSIVRKAITTSHYLQLNRVTAGSEELAALAGAAFLIGLLREAQQAASQANVSDAVEFMDKKTVSDASAAGIGERELEEIAGKAADYAAWMVERYAEAKSEAEEAVAAMGAGGLGYVHEGLSVWTFLENPDEFRRRVSILKWTAVMMRQFVNLVPTSLVQQQVVSEVGGVMGVAKMLRESQLKDLTAEELAYLAMANGRLGRVARMYFALRVLQKQANVVQRAASIRPVIFVDKSGSMAETFEGGEAVPKISVAAGFALALYRKLQGEVYMFDTEVDKVSPKEVVKTLLTIKADGGTDITEVFREILRIGRRDYVYVIVTDAIEDPDREVIEELKRRGLAQRIRFILVPPAWEKEWLTENFKYYRVTDVASFTRAAVEALRS